MKVTVGNITIEKNGVVLELTSEEAKQLYNKLQKTFGISFDFGMTKTNGEAFGSFTYTETTMPAQASEGD
jgi:hypothetical protein